MPLKRQIVRCSLVVVAALSCCMAFGCTASGYRQRVATEPGWVFVLHQSGGGQDSVAGAERLEESGGFDEFDEFDEFDGEEVFDPLIWFNRGIYHFNDSFYLRVWEPVAKGYRFIVPEPMRVGVNHAYNNLKAPPRFLGALLQLKGERAEIEFRRFLINSTLGVVGFFDVADSRFDLSAPPPEDFGQTLGHWGVGEGFPIVIPFLGPSNLRDGVGKIADSFAQPVAYFVPFWTNVGITAGDHFNYSSLHIGEYQSLKADALDPYTFFRDAYHQRRLKQIDE